VDGLHLQNVNIYTSQNEKRPPIVFDRINRADLVAVNANVKNSNSALIHIRNAKNIFGERCSSFDQCKTLVEIEGNTVEDLLLSNNSLHAGQDESVKVDALTDPLAFEDFNTEIKYGVGHGNEIKGLSAHDLQTPLKISLDITKRGALQLCLLILNESTEPQKVIVKYQGVSQEFLISWGDWGWAPISLLKRYDKNENIEFEIMAEDPGSKLIISKVYLRYQDIGFTD
jgi:hypothetical protein